MKYSTYDAVYVMYRVLVYYAVRMGHVCLGAPAYTKDNQRVEVRLGHVKGGKLA